MRRTNRLYQLVELYLSQLLNACLGSKEDVSMHHLKLFPIKELKIDRKFVSTIGINRESDRLLIAMIRFAQALSLKIVAEGIETKEQADFCAVNGCTILQGYYYSKPISAAEFEANFFTHSRLHTE